MCSKLVLYSILNSQKMLPVETISWWVSTIVIC